ncbi:FecR protein [Planctomycetes bacterium Pan216]|uniref:FecR protein n=1 Tax=Kolteria novifilia TaxID=2527975 RepID=A0A518B4C8_9BACT|nr:FecR protein [Planctomycetes bacterium Pan216]
MTTDSNDELMRLINDLAEGSLSEDQSHRLQELLRDDPAAQDAYREFMSLHANLHLSYDAGADGTGLPGLAAMPGNSMLAPSFDTVGASEKFVPSGRVARSRDRWSGIHRVLLLSLLAAVLVNAGLMWRMNSVPPSPDQKGANALASAEPSLDVKDGLAVITRTVDARWEDAPSGHSAGAVVGRGRVRLAEGLVQFEFFSGASVIVEGPADLELVSSMRVDCRLGKLRAHVPSQAHGFTVGTPGVDAVDLGTEFAVSVTKRGDGEVHVLDGEVELHPVEGQSGMSGAKQLLAGQGARYAVGGDAETIPSDPKQFVDRETMLRLSDDQHQARRTSWLTHSRRLRDDPSTLLYYRFDDHPAWERVLHHEGSGSGAGLDGAIVGCAWTQGRWPGKGALEFKRPTDRVRIDVDGEFDAMTFAAWVRIEGYDQWLSSLMLTDGFDFGEPHWQLSDKGEIILGVSGDPGVNYFSPRVLGPSDLGRWVHLATVYDPARGAVTHYVDGEIVSRDELREPIRLRIGPAEIGNWNSKGSGRHGIRSLNGRIDEFGLFGRAFSDEEIREMFDVGRPD